MKQFKNNKAPGPDSVIVELYRYISGDNLKLVLQLVNECWHTESIPRLMKEANVASLYKQGDTQNLAKYRPIALLNYMYKLLAVVI